MKMRPIYIALWLAASLWVATVSTQVQITPASAVNGGGSVSRNLTFSPDATYDIGVTGQRPKDVVASGTVYAGGVYVNGVGAPLGSFNMGYFAWQSDGVVRLANNAVTGFSRLILGTNDASGMAIAKGASTLNFVVGNDSAFVGVKAASYTTAEATGTLVTNDAQTVANNGTVSLGTNASQGLFVLVAQQGSSQDGICLYALQGTGTATVEVNDAQGVCSTTAGTGTSYNIYWDAGDTRYELQNTRGGDRSVRLIRLGV